MSTAPTRGGLFPALLKFWRGKKGMSQLDLAIAADVSARHVSFLETGRAAPRAEMVLRLGAALAVPLRDQNAMLRAAGMEPHFAEPEGDAFEPAVARVLERMLEQQEPYPLIVVDRRYDILRANGAAQRLLARFVADPARLADGIPNAFRLLFEPGLLRDAVEHWEMVASQLLWRLHREALDRPEDGSLAALVEELHQHPAVPAHWRQPDLSRPSPAVLGLSFRRGDLRLSFITTVTAFSAPHNVALEEMRIESYFPADAETAAACEALARDG